MIMMTLSEIQKRYHITKYYIDKGRKNGVLPQQPVADKRSKYFLVEDIERFITWITQYKCSK